MDIAVENYVTVGNLQVRKELFELVKKEISPGTNIPNKDFWSSLEKLLHDYTPRNAELLKKRDTLQKRIDAWHIEHRGKKHKLIAYKKFLKDIGYLVDEISDFQINTTNVDDEIADFINQVTDVFKNFS